MFAKMTRYVSRSGYSPWPGGSFKLKLGSPKSKTIPEDQVLFMELKESLWLGRDVKWQVLLPTVCSLCSFVFVCVLLYFLKMSKLVLCLRG